MSKSGTVKPDKVRLPAAYWRLWTASTISNLGDGVFLVALPLLAARITDSPRAISLVGTFAALPYLLFALPIGALIDRTDRRTVLIRADTFRALVVGVLAIVVATGRTEIWMLWVIALCLGIAEVFFDNASQAIVPAIVPVQGLERANGRRYSAEIAANTFIGTPLGSVLFAIALWIPFGFDAISFLVAVLLVKSISGSFRTAQPTGTNRSLYSEVRSGLRWLWRNRLLRGLAIALSLTNLGFQMSQAIFVLFAKDVVGISERWFGVLVGAMGIGAVVGGLIGDRVVARVGQLFALYTSAIIWILTLLAVGLVPVTWFITLIAAIEALAATIWNVVTVSLRQSIVPNHLFGRVNSVYRWFAFGTIPLGAAIGGQVATTFGLRAPYFVGAGVVFIALLILLRTVTPARLETAKAERRDTSRDDTPPSIEREPWDAWHI